MADSTTSTLGAVDSETSIANHDDYTRYTPVTGCNCPVCLGVQDVETASAPVADTAGIPQLDSYGFLLDVSNPASGLVGTTMANGLTILSAYESAAQIARPGGTFATLTSNLEVTYSFDAIRIDTASYAAFDADYQAATREVLAQYASLTGLTFREVTGSTVPNIQFQNILGQYGGGGWASYPSSGTGYNAIGYPWTAGDVYAGSYVYNTILHEVGHSLGLAHPGNYNGSNVYPDDSVVWNDSRQYSVMSYNGASTTGANQEESASTPMLHDILAIQMEYGFNWSTRADNTVYGFNSNTGLTSYTFTALDKTSAFSIWDGAGVDTLDFSGFATDTVMDLRQGGFSSTGLETYNVSIAYFADVENAIGGSGDDKIRGNDLANVLTGGAGQDLILGGSETPVSTAVDPRQFTGISLNQDPLVHDQYLSLTGVQALSGAAFSVEMMVELTRPPASSVSLLSYAVTDNANELLIYAVNDGTVRVIIDGQAAWVSTLSTRSLVDGDPHRLSMTWDSGTGAIALYVDGALADSGTYTAATGRTLATGGTLIVGQDQDSLGGGFNTGEVLQGTVGDIRVFNDVRTAAEIAAAAFTTVSPSAQGLVHNWQVQSGDTTTVTDVATANPAVNLTDLLPAAFTVSQSSSYDASSGAAYVLDNSTGTFNHTRNSGDEWLLLSFQQPMAVSYVEIVNRPTWGSRLNGATVSVLDAQGQVLYTSAPITGAASGATLTFMLPQVMNASAVRIDQDTNYLHIAEINVYGSAPAGTPVPAALLQTDLAIQGGALAVSTAPVIDTAPDNDTLYGGAGNDTLMGGAGNDVLYGGTGAVSPFQAGWGVALNQGVTDQYLQVANFGGLAGASGQVRFTVEMMVSGLSGYNELLSYANSQSSNAFLVSLLDGGNIQLTYRGSTVTTGVAASLLTDGGTHRFSLSWDNKAYVIYVDGVAVGSGTHTSSSTSLNAGGTLIIGQEQDSIGGGFQSSQILSGTVSDIRVFNDVRTAAEIAAYAFAPLSQPAQEQGLVANWQVSATSVSQGVVQDALGGTALSILTTGGSTVQTGLLGAWDNDSLVGGLGADTLVGGAGDDTYVVDNAGDVVTELAGEGTDLVQSSISYTAAANVENVTLTGVSALNATGNTLNNVLTGNAGANVLDGGAGADTLIGAAGDDYYKVDEATDVVVELAGGGYDKVQAKLSYTLGANVEQLILVGGDLNGTGNELANALFGTTGANVLDGGLGADTLSGGAGNDTYVVDNVGDVVTEQAGQGMDLVQSSISYTAAANVENVTLTGVSALNATGNTLNNVLTGNAGANVLDGGAGADTLIGGLGDDYYKVDEATDVVVEQAGGGYDKVQAKLSYTLGANVEQLILVGGDLNGTGNELANTLFGTTGANVLDGGLGADTLRGGAGNDTYVVDNAGDVVTELTGEGTDLVLSSISYTAGLNVENVTLTGTASINATGNTLNNVLTGNAGANVLDGGAGTDTLIGGLGDDYYKVDEATDVVVELAGGGYDKVQAKLSYTLGANVEQLILVGGGLNGTGNELANTLFGTTGVNVLDGGLGADTLIGGAGSDTYLINSLDGAEEIRDYGTSAADLDVVQFGAGIDADDLWFSRTGDDLVVSVLGDADRLVIDQWYAADGWQIEEFRLADGSVLNDKGVDYLVSQMAGYGVTPPASLSALAPDAQTAVLAAVADVWV